MYLAIDFSPSNTNYQQSYLRVNYLELLFGLGSILYMLRSISNGLVSNLSHFSIDNSMIRKLYSKSKRPEDDMKAHHDYNVVKGENKTQTLYGNLDKRASFNYTWK